MDKFTVRSNDGSVDVTASTAAYANALSKWVSDSEISTESVAGAVDAVFDQHTGRLTIPVLVSYTMAILNPSPAQFSAVEARIRAFVKGSPRFDSTKGKGGGVSCLYKSGETPVAKASKVA